jgi:glycerol-3-phosphate O-acyltransferase
MDVMLAQSRIKQDRILTPENIYQEQHAANRALFFSHASHFLNEGSGIGGLENLARLGQLAADGHSCLVFSEHLSNLDVPTFWMLMKLAGPEYEELFDRIVFIAGRKLNEESGVVKIFAEMFTRIIISPKSFYDSLPDGAEKERPITEAHAINMAAYRKIRELNVAGRIFLIYPTGTRYRHWEPSTGRGLREVEGYLRIFEYFLLASCEGNIMPIAQGVDMADETPRSDRVYINFGPVQESAIFRQRLLNEHTAAVARGDDIPDEKQYIMDQIMAGIAALHKGS